MIAARVFEQVACGSREAIKPRHRQHVAVVELGEQPAELRPVGLAPLATSRYTASQPAAFNWRTWASTLWPSVDNLAYPYFMGINMHQTYATKKLNLSKLTFLIRIS